MLFKTLVRPEHLNHNGSLFGGYMLLWVDEYAYIAALEDYPGAVFVTRGMDAASFSQGVSDGAVLTFDVRRVSEGNTSVTYSVSVSSMDLPSPNRRIIFSTRVTMCNTDGHGNKAALPKCQ